MKQGAQVQAALEILTQFSQERRPIDRLSQAYFRQRRYIGSKDRQYIADLVYDIIRQKSLLEWWSNKVTLEESFRSYLLIHLRKENLEVLFSGEEYHPSRLTSQEKSLLSKVPQDLYGSFLPRGAAYGYPEWMEPLLERVFMKEHDAELKSLSNPAPFDLRVNPQTTSRIKMHDELSKIGFQTEMTPYSPFGLRSLKRFPLDQTKAFQEGRVEVQDEGSQLICLLSQVDSFHQVMDFCAGAGGKTLLLAALMQNKGHIIATDIHDKRLRECKKRLKRAGIENTHCRLLSPENDLVLKRAVSKMDRVIVDAPCSGSGTWRRNPDLKWRFSREDLQEIIQKQQSILQAAEKFVKPGGRLIYATCSLFLEENDHQIEKFLRVYPNFTLLPITPIWEESLKSPCPVEGPYLKLTPYKHKTDGFFAAILRKNPS